MNSSQQTRWLSSASSEKPGTSRFSPATPAASSQEEEKAAAVSVLQTAESSLRMDRTEATSEKSQLVLERNAKMYSLHLQRWEDAARLQIAPPVIFEK